MAEPNPVVEDSWEALRAALEPLPADTQSALLSEFARLVTTGMHAWINRPREEPQIPEMMPPAPWDSVTSRQEFIAWGKGLLRKLEEHTADVEAHPGEWKPEWEDTWANTDLWAYLEAMIAIVEARRFKELDWRTLAEVMDSARVYE
jgi:hypothetical protein